MGYQACMVACPALITHPSYVRSTFVYQSPLSICVPPHSARVTESSPAPYILGTYVRSTYGYGRSDTSTTITFSQESAPHVASPVPHQHTELSGSTLFSTPGHTFGMVAPLSWPHSYGHVAVPSTPASPPRRQLTTTHLISNTPLPRSSWPIRPWAPTTTGLNFPIPGWQRLCGPCTFLPSADARFMAMSSEDDCRRPATATTTRPHTCSTFLLSFALPDGLRHALEK